MAYQQSPVKVIKGQMTNKAAGLAHGDSMALQNDNKKKNPKSGNNVNEILKSYPLNTQERYEKYRELGLKQDETTKPPQDKIELYDYIEDLRPYEGPKGGEHGHRMKPFKFTPSPIGPKRS